MGVINVTPDSFSDGGDFSKNATNPYEVDISKVLYRVESYVKDGVSIVDIGGESTRPGATSVAVDIELHRTIPVIQAVKKNLDIPLSIDTSSPIVMAEAISAGVDIINDVRALSVPGAIDVALNSKVAVCLMHMMGNPRSMQNTPQYSDVVSEVTEFLKERIAACKRVGDIENRLLVDPGFGFGKTVNHNYQLLKSLSSFQDLGFPLLVGISRKSMIGEVVNRPVKERIYGTIAATILAISNGASVIRTHDVAATMDAIRVHCTYRNV